MVCAFGKMRFGAVVRSFGTRPFVLGSVAAFLFIVSLLAALWPAWSAADGDQNATLRVR